MKRSPEWWFLMAVATVLFAAIGWLLFKGLLPEHFATFVIVYAGFVLLGDGATALASEKLAPSRIHVGPGERPSVNDTMTETAIAAGDFDGEGRGRVTVRSEVWRARANRDAGVAEGDSLRVLGRDGLTLLVEPGDS